MLEAKTPPQCKVSEQSLLGGLLIDGRKFPDVIEILSGDEFYQPSHRRIYAAMTSLFNCGQAVDAVTVLDMLSRQEKLKEAGGASYIAGLTDSMGSPGNAAHYARIVAEKAQGRRLLQAAFEIEAAVYSGQDSDMIADQAESVIFGITCKRIKSQFHHIGGIVHSNMETLRRRLEDPGKWSGVDTGFPDLNRLTGGFQKSDLIILAARPSMGKTALALSIAMNLAKQKLTTGFFSLEMSKEQLGLRLLCQGARIDSQKIRSGLISQQEKDKLSSAAAVIEGMPIYIDDTSALSPLELRTKTRRLMSRHGLDLVVVDYLQLMTGPKSERKDLEVAEVSRSLKGLAKELNIPVVALSQLNRKVEERSNKRPVMSDLRETGALEQDADLIAFIYRDEVYNRDSEYKGIAEIIIEKQRNGPTGIVRLHYNGPYARFESLSFE